MRRTAGVWGAAWRRPGGELGAAGGTCTTAGGEELPRLNHQKCPPDPNPLRLHRRLYACYPPSVACPSEYPAAPVPTARVALNAASLRWVAAVCGRLLLRARLRFLFPPTGASAAVVSPKVSPPAYVVTARAPSPAIPVPSASLLSTAASPVTHAREAAARTPALPPPLLPPRRGYRRPCHEHLNLEVRLLDYA